jgi:hypothetical protein
LATTSAIGADRVVDRRVDDVVALVQVIDDGIFATPPATALLICTVGLSPSQNSLSMWLSVFVLKS